MAPLPGAIRRHFHRRMVRLGPQIAGRNFFLNNSMDHRALEELVQIDVVGDSVDAASGARGGEVRRGLGVGREVDSSSTSCQLGDGFFA